MLHLSPNPSGIRLLLDPELDRLREMYGSVPSVRNCITCKGAKQFLWRSPTDPSRFEMYKCNCREQYALHLYFLHCGIELHYQRLSWRDVHVEEAAEEQVMEYMARLKRFVDAGFGLILHGEVGTGKTLLTSLLLKFALAEGIDGFFLPFSRMVTLFAEGWKDSEKANWFRRRIENTTLLVLDDLGKEHVMHQEKEDGVLKDFSTSLTGRTLDAVLRHRAAASKPTILTTNWDLERLKSGYGTNVFSLLEERAHTYRFTGENFRPTHKVRSDWEIDHNLQRPIVIA